MSKGCVINDRQLYIYVLNQQIQYQCNTVIYIHLALNWKCWFPLDSRDFRRLQRHLVGTNLMVKNNVNINS